MRKGFSLVELLVVIAGIALLAGILVPVMGKVRLQARILAATSDLKQIGLALETYGLEHEEFPPTRVDCALGDHFYQLPLELTAGGYLPAPSANSKMAVNFEDVFNRGYTYKYRSVGDLIYNRTQLVKNAAYLGVPVGFPKQESDEIVYHRSLGTSPVSWIVYSQGPKFDLEKMKAMEYPVPTKTWYNPKNKSGIITRVRLTNGDHIGSFKNLN